MPFLISLIESLLGNAVIRAFLEGVAVKVFAELLFKTEQDPVFKTNFLTLSAQLSAADTPEAKRAILQKIQSLRSTPTPSPSVQPRPPDA